MTDEDLAEVRRALREELRKVGLRPPSPPGCGVWRWCAERDEWPPLLEADPPPMP